MGNGADSRILFQNVGRIIRRAVIDDNDIVCIPAYLLNDCRQCLPVVVGGNNDDNLQFLYVFVPELMWFLMGDKDSIFSDAGILALIIYLEMHF